MKWQLTADRYGLEAECYRIRPHPAKNGRWIAAWQPYCPGWGLGQNQRVVFGAYSTTTDAKRACERHAAGQPIATESKPCRICGEIKPLSEYHSSAPSRDGRKSGCKKCLNQRTYERRQKKKAEK